MSGIFTFVKRMDEDEVELFLRRLRHIRAAVAAWEFGRINQYQGYLENAGRSPRDALVFLSRKEDNITLKLVDKMRGTSIAIIDETTPTENDSQDYKERDLALIDHWIQYGEATFNAAIRQDLHAEWQGRIKEARTLCAAIVSSTGHKVYAAIDLPGGGLGFSLGSSDYGIDGGILKTHVNAILQEVAPHTVVIEYDSNSGAAEYRIRPACEMPEDIEIDIDPSSWPDDLSILRSLARMDGVAKPWTHIKDEIDH